MSTSSRLETPSSAPRPLRSTTPTFSKRNGPLSTSEDQPRVASAGAFTTVRP